MFRRNVCFVLFWTWGVFASCFRSLWLVKVCQWVTLTPVRRCREGGADEVGHMVAHCSLTRNSRCNKTSPSNHLELLRCLRRAVLPVLSLNGPRSISTRSPIPLKTNRRFSLPETIRQHCRGRETVLRFSEKTWLLGLTWHFTSLCNLHFR